MASRSAGASGAVVEATGPAPDDDTEVGAGAEAGVEHVRAAGGLEALAGELSAAGGAPPGAFLSSSSSDSEYSPER